MNDSTAGYTTIPNWMLAADDVSAQMVLVYAALGTWTDREGAAWPAVPKIAERAKMSERSARAALRALEALGLVETVRRSNPNGGQTSNLYRLHVTATPRQEMQGVQEMQGPPAPDADKQEPGQQASTDVDAVKRTRGSRIPEPFMVTTEMWAWAHDEGMTREFANEQTVIFVDYWRGRTGQIAVKADWPATWRNWLRRAWKDGRSRAPMSPGRESPDERFRRLQALADQMEAGDGGQRAVEA